MKITGRTILITGGSAGIGLAFALKFLELGNQVIVTGRRQTVLHEVKAKYPKLHTIQGDVADPAQIASLATRVKAEYPRLDVLMNNAGIMLHKNLKVPATDLDGLMAEMNINVGRDSHDVRIHRHSRRQQGNRHQRILWPRLRAAAVSADLLCHQGGDSLLHPIAPVPVGGVRR